jgi:hypothetical protein
MYVFVPDSPQLRVEHQLLPIGLARKYINVWTLVGVGLVPVVDLPDPGLHDILLHRLLYVIVDLSCRLDGGRAFSTLNLPTS